MSAVRAGFKDVKLEGSKQLGIAILVELNSDLDKREKLQREILTTTQKLGLPYSSNKLSCNMLLQ